jgi:hypothetical protein
MVNVCPAIVSVPVRSFRRLLRNAEADRAVSALLALDVTVIQDALLLTIQAQALSANTLTVPVPAFPDIATTVEPSE